MSSAENQLATVTPLPGFARMVPSEEQVELTIASTLPAHDFAIEDIVASKSTRFDGGTHIEREYVFSDGSHHRTAITLPRKPLHERPLSHRLPWCTDLKGLYGEFVDVRHAQEGSISIRTSAQQPSLLRAARNVITATFTDSDLLSRYAYAHHLVLDDIRASGIADTTEVLDTGDSQSAMTNLAFQAYAANFDRTVPYSDLTDPCIEHKVRPRLHPHDIGRLIKYIGVTEPRELITAIQEYTPQELRIIARTAPLSAAFWIHQAAVGHALFGGAAGGFVDHIPNNSVTAVRFFNQSQLNHADAFKARLAPFKGIHIYEEDGTHLSIARRDVQESTIARISLVQELLDGAVTPQELDAAKVVNRIGPSRPSALSGRLGRAVRRLAQTAN